MNYYSRTIKQALYFIRKYPIYYVGVFLRLVYFGAEVAIPVLFGLLINDISAGKRSWNDIWIIVVLYCGVKFFGPILEIISGYINWTVCRYVSRDYRRDKLNLIAKALPNYWGNKQKGEVVSSIGSSANSIGVFAAQLNQSYLGMAVDVISILVASVLISPWVLLILVINFLLFWLMIRVVTPKERDLAIIEEKLADKRNGRILEFFNNFSTVLYLNLFDRELKDIQKYESEQIDAFLKREKVSIFQKWFVNNSLHGVTIAIILVVLLYEVVQGSTQIGTLTTVMVFSERVLGKLSYLVELITVFVQTSVSVERTEALIDKEINTAKTVSNPIFNDVFKEIVFENVSLFRENQETLKQVNLQLHRGKKIAIVGYSGSGKSTIMDIILQVETGYSGNVLVNATNLQDISPSDLGSIISIVPQHVQLFRDTIEENLLLGNSVEKDLFEQVIHDTLVDTIISIKPDGLQTQLNESNSNLSGGEKQRIGIARSLIMQRPMLILDEATASLDPKTEKDVIKNLITNYPNQTLVYITHKYNLLGLFDTIYVLNEGMVVESGTFSELIKNGGMFRDLYDAQNDIV